MFKVALKNLLGHKLRTLFTAIAIALGVGFMAGTFVLTDTITETFDDLFTEAFAGLDAVVQGEEPFESSAIETGGQRPDIDASVVDLVAEVEGVAVAEPGVGGIAYLLDPEGEPYVAGGAPSFGGSWSGNPDIDSFTLEEGEDPVGPSEVVIDGATADTSGLGPGDEAQVQTLSGTFTVTVAGIARFGESGNLGGAAFVLMETDAAIEAFGTPGKVQAVYVIAEEGLTEEEVVERIEPVLPDGVEAVTAAETTEENQDVLEQGIGFLRTFLTAVGVVSLAAGAFLIYNTFGIIIGQRMRELALLRALGSSRRQVMVSVLVESFVIGLLASLLGLVGGILLALGMIELIEAFGVELPGTLPVVAPRTIIVSLLVGTTITVLSSIAPAFRASRVAPVAALRETAVEGPSRSLVRLVIGLAVAAIGVAVMVTGTQAGEVGQAAGGTVGLFAGLVILGPFLVPLIVSAIGWPLRFLGFAGHLGRDNARRNPKRSAGTAASLMLAVTIITFIAVSTLSFTDSFNSATDKYLRADLEISSGTAPVLGPALVDSLAGLDEVRAVTGVQRGQVQIDDEVRPVYGVTTSAVLDIFDLQGVEGDLAAMGPEHVAIDRETADEEGLGIGDTVSVLFPDSTEAALEVKAIYEDAGIIAQNTDGHYLLDAALFQQHFGANNQWLLRVDVRAAEGVDVGQLRSTVEAELDAFPTATVRDKEELKDEARNQLLVALGFLFVLLGLALVIGALGVTITLALSVFERTREIGLLRAVGASRGQMAVAICAEAVLLTLLGTIMGLVVGVLGAVAVVRSQSDSLDTLQVSIPVPFILAVLVVAVAIGVLAAVVPAWRAARMNVLDAVTVE